MNEASLFGRPIKRLWLGSIGQDYSNGIVPLIGFVTSYSPSNLARTLYCGSGKVEQRWDEKRYLEMPNISDDEIRQRKASLLNDIRRLSPDFVKACSNDEDVIILHQDSFAADYQEDEYTLLGMAIKFAGLHGKELHIIGTNRETLKGPGKPELVH